MDFLGERYTVCNASAGILLCYVSLEGVESVVC